MKLTEEDTKHRILAYFLFTEPSKLPFVNLPTPEWINALGFDIKKMLNDKIIKDIYFDNKENIVVKFSNDFHNLDK